MQTSELDVVYVVRPHDFNPELKYSLRSIAENLPHRNVIISGHKPGWVRGVKTITTMQGADKHTNILRNLINALRDPDLSDYFVYMNDDFYVMSKSTEIENFNRGPMSTTIEQIRADGHTGGAYIKGMERAYKLCKQIVKEPLSFELHTPMILNKHDLLDMLEDFPPPPPGTSYQFRSMYGNIYYPESTTIPDVKVKSLEKPETIGQFLSTTDTSFKGEAGKIIIERFKAKGKYEV